MGTGKILPILEMTLSNLHQPSLYDICYLWRFTSGSVMDRMVRCWSDRTPVSLFFWVLTTISNETQHDTIERTEMKFKHHNASPLVTSRISHHVDEACIRLGCFVCSVGRGLDHARKTLRCFQATGGRALFFII